MRREILVALSLVVFGCEGPVGEAGPAGEAGPEGPPGEQGEPGEDAGCTADADCDDGLFCNGTETCDVGSGDCNPGTAPDCGDAVSCTVDFCDEGADQCLAFADGSLCESFEVCVPTAGCQGDLPLVNPECQLADFAFGRAIDIVSTGPATADVTVEVTLDTAELIGDAKMAADCADLRIVDGEGNQLPYFIDSGCDTSNTSVQVRLAELPFGQTRIYAQYGNESAPAASDASAAFIFFDDFESGSLDARWRVGANSFQSGHDDGHEEEVSAEAAADGSGFGLRLRADSSCFRSPFDGVGAFAAVDLALPPSTYCVDFDARADSTGFEFRSGRGSTFARVFADGDRLFSARTQCGEADCPVDGSFTSESLQVPGSTLETLRLEGRTSDCADGNALFDNVRVYGCVVGGEVFTRVVSELDCAAL